MKHLWALVAVLVGCAAAPPEARYTVESAETADGTATKLVILRDEIGGFEAAIAPSKGGELSGLRVRHGGEWIETLQLARDYSPREGFAGKGPILWPATGRNFPADLVERQEAGDVFNAGAYEYGGVRRNMPIHGFARDMPWTVGEIRAEEDEASVSLSLSDSPETRALYPFGFVFAVEYVVRGGALEMLHIVRAADDNAEPMFFSIGNHITFLTPLIEGSDPDAMVLRSPSSMELLKTSYGIPTGESRSLSYADGFALGEYPPLTATSLTGYPPDQDPWIEYIDPAGLTMRISHRASQIPDPPVILFNVWGDVRAGFFSPEPWVGLQNSLVQRQGLIYLDPGTQFTWDVRVSHSATDPS